MQIKWVLMGTKMGKNITTSPNLDTNGNTSIIFYLFIATSDYVPAISASVSIDIMINSALCVYAPMR